MWITVHFFQKRRYTVVMADENLKRLPVFESTHRKVKIFAAENNCSIPEAAQRLIERK